MSWVEDFGATICPLVDDTSHDVPVRKNRHIESNIQVGCVKWFRYQYPEYILASIPNGGKRGVVTAKVMKMEGALAGMPDLFLYHACGGWHGMAIELKTKTGRQCETQKEIQDRMAKEGYLYIVVRSFEEFVEQVENYINNKIIRDDKH